MKNKEIAGKFDEMADIMEIKGENAFRVRSYRNVAETLRGLGEDIEKIAKSKSVESLPGVGKSSAQKIYEYLEEGVISAYDELIKGFPLSALELTKIPDVGPRTAAKLMNEKGVTSIHELEEAIDAGRLEGMDGIGRKKIGKMKKGITFVKSYEGRILLGKALPTAQNIVDELVAVTGCRQIEIAGSLRRMRETIGDIDILAGVDEAGKYKDHELIKEFIHLDIVSEIIAAGETKASIRTDDGMQVDLRVVEKASFGAALQYFTGSKAHNVKLRGKASAKGHKINEYGVFSGDEKVAGESEKGIYASLGLPMIPPELREDRGEIEAAQKGALPDLLNLSDIKGELHSHCTFSDGDMTVEEMAYAAKGLGYQYLALTDHSQNLTVAEGLDEDTLRRKNEEIDAVNDKIGNFIVLKGTEVDILKNGDLDYADSVLKELDWVIASIHDHFSMTEDEMTERIIAAIRNQHVDCIGHLTGRMLNSREAYPVRVSKIIETCAECSTALELNAHPVRLDINDITCREAKSAGVKVAIGSDAHNARQLELIKYGVAAARRGWLESEGVLNTLSVSELIG